MSIAAKLVWAEKGLQGGQSQLSRMHARVEDDKGRPYVYLTRRGSPARLVQDGAVGTDVWHPIRMASSSPCERDNWSP